MPKIHNAPAPSGRDDWTTDPELFERLNREFGFAVDVAASPGNALCQRYITNDPYYAARCDATDPEVHWGLAGETVWNNPPYGRGIPKWLLKAVQQLKERETSSVHLLPAAVETKWFHEIAVPNAREIRLIKGRLKFGNVVCKDGSVGTHFATFPSAVIIFQPRKIRQLWSGARIRTWDWRRE